MSDSFSFETPVIRRSDNGETSDAIIRDLRIGEVFVHDDKTYQITTAKDKVGNCSGGRRVFFRKQWCFVVEQGQGNLLFKLEDPTDPFSKPIVAHGKHGFLDAPFPDIQVEILTFIEMLPIPRPEHPFSHPSTGPRAAIPEGSFPVDMRTTSELNDEAKARAG